VKNKRMDIMDEANLKTKVFDSLSVPTLILKPNKIIVDANARFLERFRVSKAQVVGKTCHDFFYHLREPCPHETCALARTLEDRQGHSAVKIVATGEGEEKWDNRVFSPIVDETGEVRYVVECIHDMTPVKTLERELSDAREFTQKIIRSSTCAMIAADRKGRILMMNPAAEELTGYSLKEARGKVTAEDLYPPGEAKKVMKILRDERIGGKGKLNCTRISMVNARGEDVPVELSAAIIYEGDKEVGTMSVFNDLREKLRHEKQMEQMLLRIARAEKMASLGQLAAGVAHEINNPLTGIIFFSKLVLDTLEKDDPRRENLAAIFEDAKRCGKIVTNLLAYSRQANPGTEVLHIHTLLEHSLNLIRDRKAFMHIRVVKELSEEMMLIRGDRDQLSQVIVNLVMNALDAMDRRGTLTLRTFRDKSAKKACLEVSDTGGGIPADKLSVIFDPFFTTKKPGKGTGLGLSTAQKIVTENGGNIRVKETGRSGTTFLVEFPLFVTADEDHAGRCEPS